MDIHQALLLHRIFRFCSWIVVLKQIFQFPIILRLMMMKITHLLVQVFAISWRRISPITTLFLLWNWRSPILSLIWQFIFQWKLRQFLSVNTRCPFTEVIYSFGSTSSRLLLWDLIIIMIVLDGRKIYCWWGSSWEDIFHRSRFWQLQYFRFFQCAFLVFWLYFCVLLLQEHSWKRFTL